MQVRDVMTRSFQSIGQQTTLHEAAVRMRDLDVGMLPVNDNGEITGTLTDRDITIRGTAQGADPYVTTVGAIMSSEVVYCREDDELDAAARIMEQHQIRRLLVRNTTGEFTGMLSVADLARHPDSEPMASGIMEEVSQPKA